MTDQEALIKIVEAWDSLRAGNYSRDIIERWLTDKMKPAIEAARRALRGASDPEG